MAASAPGQEIDLWHAWLGMIEEEIVAMMASREIWQGYVEMVRANPNIQTPGTFHSWVVESYGNRQALGIRRQVDERRDVVSLARLLIRIRGNVTLLSRSHYVQAHDPNWRREADGWFDKLVGAGAQHPSRAAVEADRERLHLGTQLIRDFVNNRLAHLSLREQLDFPTYADVHSCLDVLFDVFRKYRLLIVRADIARDVALGPWQVVFQRRWLEDGPTTSERAQTDAMRKVARLDPAAQARLLLALTSTSRVRAEVIRQMFDRPADRQLAEVLMDLDGDDRLREAVIEVLKILTGRNPPRGHAQT